MLQCCLERVQHDDAVEFVRTRFHSLGSDPNTALTGFAPLCRWVDYDWRSREPIRSCGRRTESCARDRKFVTFSLIDVLCYKPSLLEFCKPVMRSHIKTRNTILRPLWIYPLPTMAMAPRNLLRSPLVSSPLYCGKSMVQKRPIGIACWPRKIDHKRAAARPGRRENTRDETTVGWKYWNNVPHVCLRTFIVSNMTAILSVNSHNKIN
ncbi:hypothetical protein F5Y18DRAFT_231969 [Xylariaceae sp. FL1019]|nr:hypothetical protein F5Y18DRAFT_231969 [Xylariaceae sp. FL1019]